MSKRDRLKRLERQRTKQGEKITEIWVYLTGEDGLIRRSNSAGEVLETLTKEELEDYPSEVYHVRPA